VGTPIDDTGYADVSQVAHALEQAVPAVATGAVWVVRSTLPVGSAVRLASRSGIALERLFVAPEFMRQGSALEDIRRLTRISKARAAVWAAGAAVDRVDGLERFRLSRTATE